MPTTTPIESALQSYLERLKFSHPAVWNNRGLNQSRAEVVDAMEAFVNTVCAAALASVRAGRPATATRRAILVALKRVKASNFDTEEREFLCSEVEGIANIAQVPIGPELNTWLYGRLLGSMVNIANARRR